MPTLDIEDIQYMTLPEYLQQHEQTHKDAFDLDLKMKIDFVNDMYADETALIQKSFTQIIRVIDDQIQLHEDQIRRDVRSQRQPLPAPPPTSTTRQHSSPPPQRSVPSRSTTISKTQASKTTKKQFTRTRAVNTRKQQKVESSPRAASPKRSKRIRKKRIVHVPS